MTVVYIFAHFDDEYCALPVIDRWRMDKRDQLFLYVADYDSPRVRAQRHAETRRFLAWLGVDPAKAVHVGADSGVADGGVYRALPTAHAALEAALKGVEVLRVVCPAWEGGHMDHDMCALLAAQVAQARGGVPVEMVSLYNAPDLPAPFFHGARPLPQNGPVNRYVLWPGYLFRWMLAVRFFWLQRAWLGLWPTMFWTFWTRGFGTQGLDPARIRERPHPGPLLYERMFKVPYEEVRGAADAFLSSSRAGRS